MKKLLLAPPLIALIYSLAVPAWGAEFKLQPTLAKQPLTVQLLAAAMRGCMGEQLTPLQVTSLDRTIEAAANRIDGYCRAGQERYAYEAVQYYMQQPEGIAALTCATQLAPLLEDPNLAKIAAPYQADIQAVLNKQAPSPICR